MMRYPTQFGSALLVARSKGDFQQGKKSVGYGYVTPSNRSIDHPSLALATSSTGEAGSVHPSSMGKRRLKDRVKEAGEAFEAARAEAVEAHLDAARPDDELFFVDTEARCVFVCVFVCVRALVAGWDGIHAMRII